MKLIRKSTTLSDKRYMHYRELDMYGKLEVYTKGGVPGNTSFHQQCASRFLELAHIGKLPCDIFIITKGGCNVK